MQDEKNKGRTRCEVYSRVVGFLSPLSQWNRGKKEEYKDRVTFDKVLKEGK
jgi:ribonucleoside-triphosphate reductase